MLYVTLLKLLRHSLIYQKKTSHKHPCGAHLQFGPYLFMNIYSTTSLTSVQYFTHDTGLIHIIVTGLIINRGFYARGILQCEQCRRCHSLTLHSVCELCTFLRSPKIISHDFMRKIFRHLKLLELNIILIGSHSLDQVQAFVPHVMLWGNCFHTLQSLSLTTHILASTWS